MSKRINVIFPDDLLAQVDASAKALGLSRSGWLIQSAVRAVSAQSKIMSPAGVFGFLEILDVSKKLR